MIDGVLEPLSTTEQRVEPEDPARPAVSVVIPTLNSAGTLARLLQSLEAQTFRDFEVLVSDGASQDATVELARSAAAALPRLRVDSRPDAGVYDAINRGVVLARGQWVIVLGADDWLHAPDTLERAWRTLSRTPADLVYGDVRMMARLAGVEAGARYAGALSIEELMTKNICQQAIFYRRRLFDELGNFDLRYRIWADWDFNLRVAFRRRIEWIDLVIADYAATGMSTRGGDALFEAEAPERLRRELLTRPLDRHLWPLHRQLLRQANRMRRRGRWADAARHVGAYLSLRVRRAFGTPISIRD